MVEDGMPSILIAANAMITSNGTMLQGMIVRLANIIHAGEEYLNVTSTEPGIALVRSFINRIHYY